MVVLTEYKVIFKVPDDLDEGTQAYFLRLAEQAIEYAVEELNADLFTTVVEVEIE